MGFRKPSNETTVCPRSSDPFYIVTYIKWLTTSWTDNIQMKNTLVIVFLYKKRIEVSNIIFSVLYGLTSWTYGI